MSAQTLELGTAQAWQPGITCNHQWSSAGHSVISRAHHRVRSKGCKAKKSHARPSFTSADMWPGLADLCLCGSLNLAELEVVLRERLLVDPSAVDTFVCGLQTFLDDASKVCLLLWHAWVMQA